MVDTDAAWLAGVLEGEGSFLVYWAKSRSGGRSPYPRVQINMTDRDVVARVALLMGGNSVQVHRVGDERLKRAWSTKVTGKRALEVMRTVRPWMGDRRGSKIDELLTEFTKEVMPHAEH